MDKIFIPLLSLILAVNFVACVTTGQGAERGRIENRTDEKITEFYWKVHYTCKGSRWSTIGYRNVGYCGVKRYKIKPDKDGKFEIPSAMFFTMLLEPEVDRHCALRYKDQKNSVYDPVNILDHELYEKTYMLILDRKTFSFTIDANTISRILNIFRKNGYQVNEYDSVMLTYSLKYQNNEKILWDFYTNSFRYTFKEMKERKNISSTGYIARPGIDGILTETFSLVLSAKNNTVPRFEYKFANDIKSDDFARTVSLTIGGENLVNSFNKYIVQRRVNADLAYAVKKGDRAGVMKALRKGADPGCDEGDVFWKAVRNQDITIITMLLDAGADAIIKKGDDKGQEMRIELLFSDMDYYKNHEGREKNKRNRKIIELLLRRGAKVRPDTDLLWEAFLIHRFDFIPLLIKNGADLNYLLTGKDRRYRLPALHRAAGLENPEKALPVIDFLIRKGSPVNIRDDNGRTALHAAMKSNYIYSNRQQYAVIKKLVSYGADVNAVDNEGNTPLHTLSDRKSLYHRAWLRNKKRDVADIKEVEAAMKPIVRFFARKGADLNAYNKMGHTPLHLCAEKNNSETALALVKCGADINKLTSGPGNWPGYSALHLAAFSTNMETIKLLVENGADLKLTTRDGLTIFDIAKTHDHPDRRLSNYLKQL